MLVGASRVLRPSLLGWRPSQVEGWKASRVEAIAIRLEAIGIRLKSLFLLQSHGSTHSYAELLLNMLLHLSKPLEPQKIADR